MKNMPLTNLLKLRTSFILITSVAMALIPPAHRVAMGQINIDSIPIPSTISEADRDAFQIQTAIDMSHAATYRPGLSSRVIIPAGRMENGQYQLRNYRLNKTIVVKGGVVLSTDSGGRRGVRLLWENVKDDQPLLRFHNCHGGGLENIAIGVRSFAQGHRGDRVTGILLESQSSTVLQNFTVDLTNAGQDATGLLVTNDRRVARHTESVTVRDFDILAPQPVVIENGDNLTFSTFDLTVAGKHAPGSISAVFQNRNGYVPANLVIGPGTGQKGDHAICFTGERERAQGTGDVFTIQNFRWEQGTAKGPAWKIDINRFDAKNPQQRLHAFESVVFINCRHAAQHSNSDYVGLDIPTSGVLTTSFFGGYYPGSYQR